MIHWIIGVVIGTALVGVTSPLFVRSYLPLTVDPVRKVWTLPPGTVYRWRSEGYANTSIGPMGMPGKTVMPPADSTKTRIALWGDSQAEGVCVWDDQKLFSQIESLAPEQVEVFPLARSGEDAADWVTQMPNVERHLDIDLHIVLVVDLPDLIPAVDAPIPPPSTDQVRQAEAAIARTLPAFVIQAARHLLTEPDGVTPRRLRFGIGPSKKTPDALVSNEIAAVSVDWSSPLQALRRNCQQPVMLLYAPKVPQIVHGRIVTDDVQADSFDQMRSVADPMGIPVIDVRDALRASAQRGDWPHGFHNGYIGSGHLNATGYHVVAKHLVESLGWIPTAEQNDGFANAFPISPGTTISLGNTIGPGNTIQSELGN